jgi:O-antigen/teichoic acid export membrane protein
VNLLSFRGFNSQLITQNSKLFRSCKLPKMPNKPSLTLNFIFNILNQLLTVIAPCITVPYLARTLGPAGLGEYSFALSLVTYFSAFTNLGVNLYGQRQIAYLKDKSKYEYSKTFWELIFLRCFTGLISIVLYYFLVVRLSQSYVLSAILTFEIISVVFDVTWLYQGFENFKIIVIRNFIVRILSIIAILVFVKEPQHLYRYAIILTGSNFLGALSMWGSLKNYVSLVPLHELKIFSHLRGAFALYVPQIAIQVYTVLDKTMLGLIAKSNYENGYYDQAHKIVNILLMVVTALGPVMIPRISNLFANRDTKAIENYIGKSFNLVWMISLPIVFGILSVADLFVPFFFGKGFDKVITLLSLFSFIIIPIGLSNIIGIQYLLPTGRERYLTISVTIGAVVNFVLNYFFIHWWQSIGATISSIIAETSVTVFQLWSIHKELPLKRYIFTAKNYLLSAGVMALILKFIPEFRLSLFVMLILKILFGSVIYIFMLLILKDSFFKKIILIGWSKIKRKLPICH